MENLNFILDTTNCLYCKFFKGKCIQENAEEHNADFDEIHELFLEDSRSFVNGFGDNERRFFVCTDYEFDNDKFINLHTRD